MTLLRKHSPVRDWLDCARISNLPTIVTDSLVGIALGVWMATVMQVGADFQWDTVAVIFGMCSFYTAGMILNGIVDRDIDARERPNRPIASGRIRLPWAWTAFIVLMLLGFFLRPTSAPTPLPIAVAALMGVWGMNYANAMRSFVLRRLAKAWCAVAIIAALWWAVDMLLKDPFDLHGFAPHAQESIRINHFALNAPTLLIAISLVAYNLLHKRTPWAIAFLALCRFLIPIVVALSILVPSGVFAELCRMWSTLFEISIWGPIVSGPAVFLLTPSTAIAIHTIMLSIVARREMASSGATYRCARCQYPLMITPSKICSECGCDFAETPPTGDRPLSKSMRRSSPFLAAIAIVPLFLILAPIVWHNAAVRAPGFQVNFLGFFSVPTWVATLVNLSLVAVTAIWFILAATRAFRAAVSHPSRRPAGIAGLIAALALLDACGAAFIQYTLISLCCILLWFVTRWLQRRIAGS